MGTYRDRASLSRRFVSSPGPYANVYVALSVEWITNISGLRCARTGSARDRRQLPVGEAVVDGVADDVDEAEKMTKSTSTLTIHQCSCGFVTVVLSFSCLLLRCCCSAAFLAQSFCVDVAPGGGSRGWKRRHYSTRSVGLFAGAVASAPMERSQAEQRRPQILSLVQSPPRPFCPRPYSRDQPNVRRLPRR
jgi:hypothetical protein